MPGIRYRAPQAASTALITPAGMARLRTEHEELWRRQRPEVVAALAAAAAEGDRSENAEYTYRKRQLAGIDRRLRYLQRRLEHLRVVDSAPTDQGAISFGAWFELESLAAGSCQCLRIVGPDEIDAALGWISIDSPLARAALKRRVDDEFSVEAPGGRLSYLVLAISYAGPIAG